MASINPVDPNAVIFDPAAPAKHAERVPPAEGRGTSRPADAPITRPVVLADRTVEISFDKEIDRYIIKIKSEQDDAIVRQIPAEEMVAVAAKLRELFGVLFDERA